MLTLTLRQLERDGLVIRTVYAEVPPRVEYRLTALGGTLVEIAHTIAHWAIANHSTIEHVPRRVRRALIAATGGELRFGRRTPLREENSASARTIVC